MSLKLALERLLGGTCHHMMEVFGHPDEVPVWHAAMLGEPVDFPAMLADYNAIVDYPGAAVWRELAATFPDAPVLLSTRSSADEWWQSASNTILALRPDQLDPDGRQMVDAVFARSLGADITDRETVKAAYDTHNATVRSEIPTERLFEYQPGDGWGPLCAALDLPVPDEPFPHTNTREEFRERAGLDDPA